MNGRPPLLLMATSAAIMTPSTEGMVTSTGSVASVELVSVVAGAVDVGDWVSAGCVVASSV
ncbi:MAG: hypothetical protein ABI706_08235 [Ilumatobacteraceae bacterium]